MREAGPKLGLTFDVEWWPFQLDPTLPKEGVDKLEHYRRKFGEFRVNTMVPRMKQVGRAHGLEFNYGGRVSNTLDSHRLQLWAERTGGRPKADALREILFRTYFKDNGDIGDAATLAAAAREAGLEGAEDFLATDDLLDVTVRLAEQKRREYGVNGVPFFVLDNRVAFSGAQDAKTIVHIMEQIVKPEGDAADDDDGGDGDDGGAAGRAAGAARGGASGL
uniref:DSBA-like thioredoxin domain-containing protein n=1 Tax=Bicosoecida sp. CB-2014 TaxID=1486930 RepID=A0A7S1CLV5_9STRA|mmetsp:Transcript_5735/g.20578  ORF Transcript_5735/g.20578 Transcript_5735/m.20578 type:complete len:220 (-) Transcript_5735:287-946(-)